MLGVAAAVGEPERFAGRRATTGLFDGDAGPADFARWVLEPPRVSATRTQTAPTATIRVTPMLTGRLNSPGWWIARGDAGVI